MNIIQQHLFVGSEGTLGIVTKVALQLYPLPTHTVVAIAKVPSFEKVSKLLRSARGALGETLSAFEYMDRKSIDAIADQYPHIVKKFSDSLFQSKRNNNSINGSNGNSKNRSIENDKDAYVLLEASSSSATDMETFLSDTVNTFLSSQLEGDIITDAIIAQNYQQEAELWKIRELIPVALAQMSRNADLSGPFLLKYDISMPWSETERVVQSIEAYLSGHCGHVLLGRDVGVNSDSSSRYLKDHPSVKAVLCVYCFGHAGDQNLHLNVILRLQEHLIDSEKKHIKESIKADLEYAALTETMKLNGSMSAEHGIGQQKSHLLEQARRPAEVQVMKLLKSSLDPLCILNPGKVIPFQGRRKE